ncbi:hypothetical protein SAMN04488700_0971 [Carnobacterium iners]|uniref:Uncharacterized protein n=1 Tax=Carnobacterium iners TaxID=1073423 RepID=A0A1X7MV56_9LACT|nr:hypothetical protein [Carnobacterium iners]SEL33558.1 hypothetical protein SAMN04488114_1554 [Carnobacterium iners]SMH28745.1 hypothetical protein SAMN04488700_0971 [Carnobacterium iners]
MKQLQDKIDNLIKKDEELSIENKKRLLGFLNIKEDMYKEIQLEAQQIVKYPSSNSYKYTYSERATIVTMAAILFCMYEVSGSRFWEELSEKYQMEELLLQYEIKDYISSFISTNSLPYYKGTTRNEYVETIQMQSVIPYNYSSRLIRIIYFMYSEDLGMDISAENVDALLNYLKIVFKSQLNKDRDIKEIRPTLITKQLQSIPKSFMQAYLTNNTRVKHIIKKYFSYFDKISKNQIPNYDSKNRLDVLFEKALKSQIYFGIKDKVRKSKLNTIQKPIIKVKIKNQANPLFYIQTPHYFINPEKIKQSKAIVKFYDNQRLLSEKEIELSEGGVSYKIDSTDNECTLFSNKIRYAITQDKMVLIDSKKDLYRQYLFFDDKEIADEVKVTEIEIGRYFYLLIDNSSTASFENCSVTQRDLTYGTLYYFKMKEQIKIIVNDQVLVDTVIKKAIVPKIVRPVENECHHNNDIYLNMINAYEYPEKKKKIANHLVDYYKNSQEYYLDLFRVFETLISEEKEMKMGNSRNLKFVLELLYKQNSIDLLKIALEKVDNFIKNNNESKYNQERVELIKICQFYAKENKLDGILSFSLTQEKKVGEDILSEKYLELNEIKKVKKSVMKDTLYFSIPTKDISKGFQNMLDAYFESIDSKGKSLNLLNRFMKEYEGVKVGDTMSLPLIDKGIIINNIAFIPYKDKQKKILGSLNGDIYYWLYTINAKEITELSLNEEKQYQIIITGGDSYEYSFDSKQMEKKENNYLLKLKNL